MLIGVKFCGGCREQYDRKQACKNIKEALACEQVEFAEAEKDRSYDALLVISGCPVKCADLVGYETEKIITVDGFDKCQQAQNELIVMINKE